MPFVGRRGWNWKATQSAPWDRGLGMAGIAQPTLHLSRKVGHRQRLLQRALLAVAVGARERLELSEVLAQQRGLDGREQGRHVYDVCFAMYEVVHPPRDKYMFDRYSEVMAITRPLRKLHAR